jgi:hypothetical protein
MELPVLRLGCAGFAPEQEAAIRAAAAASRITHWTFGAMPGADAWFINGAVARHLEGGRVAVACGEPGEGPIQLQLSDNARPVAFALPVPARLDANCTFDADQPASILDAIGIFEFVLAPQAAHFLLASHIIEQQDVLGAGAFEVRGKGHLIAVVDMRGSAYVLPSVRPGNFDVAVWKRVERERLKAPPNFAHVSLSELMWRYVSRSVRDLLPERFRTQPVFFRRAPRVDPVLVEEEHLLVMRELAMRPCQFEELRGRLGLDDGTLARALATLYYVGSITSTKARATPTAQDDLGGPCPRSEFGMLPSRHLEAAELQQLTAPAVFTSD